MKKTFGILFILLIILLVVFFLLPKNNNFLTQKVPALSPTPEIIKKIENPNVDLTNSYDVYFADLEYDPVKNSVFVLKTGNEWDEKPTYNAFPPVNSANNFNYKVKAVTNENEVIHNGWVSINKKIIQTLENKLIFRVRSINKPGAKIEVYLPGDKLLWSTNLK